MIVHSAAPIVSRVLVLGAGGFVGSAIVARCRAAGLATEAIGRREVDLLAPDAAEALAARLRPGDSVVAVSALAPVKTVGMLADNMAMIRTMAAAFEAQPPAHLVNIGSDAVFADIDTPLTETSPRAPDNLHGVMHLAREIAFATLPVRQATLRPTLIYGADDPHNGYGPNRFRRLVAAGEPIRLFGEGEERRDHVSIDDVAELATRMIANQSSGALNAATGVVTSFRQIAEMVVATSGRSVDIQGAPRSGPMPHNGYRPFDTSATAAAFPDFAYTPIEEGLRAAWRKSQHHDEGGPANG